MELDGILTQRTWEKRVSYDLVYAWEDIFSRELGIPLVGRNRMVEALYRRLPGSLTEARKIASESDFIRSHLPASIVNAYCG